MVTSGIITVIIPELANDAFKTYAVKQSNIMLVLLALGAAATLLFYYKGIRHTHFKAIIIVILCTDLFVFGMNYHIVESSPVDYFSRNKQLADFLSAQNRTEAFRTKMREGGAMLLDRNQGMIDKIQLMEGYNPLNLFRHILPAGAQAQLDLFNVKYAIRVDSAAGTMGLAENPTFCRGRKCSTPRRSLKTIRSSKTTFRRNRSIIPAFSFLRNNRQSRFRATPLPSPAR